MSLFDRRTLLFAALSSPATLVACGFEPAYGPSGAATRLQDQVRVDDPVGRPAYLFTRHFEERMGSGGRYGLSYGIELDEQAIAVSSENVATRFNLIGVVTYALRDLDSTAVLLTGRGSSFTSYSASGTTVATQAAERDAEERLMVILADQVINRLIAEADRLPT